MKDIVIIGCGGFGREVAWLLRRINEIKQQWNIVGFIDDNKKMIGNKINEIQVIGTSDWLLDKNIAVVNAIGMPSARRRVQEKLNVTKNRFPNIIAPSVIMSETVNIGKGNIICDGSILTVGINIGNFNIINLDCTIGHDGSVRDYITIYPGVHISGNVGIWNNVEIGTGSNIIQGVNICENVIIGAGAVIIKDIKEHGTYVGNPGRKIK